MLFIAKLISMVIYPVGLIFAIALAAIVLLLLKKKLAGLIVGILSITVLLVFSSPFFAWCLSRPLEGKFNPPDDFPKVSAILVLGGATVPIMPPRRYVETNDAGDRIMHGARLFKKGYAPFLICSGGKIPFLADFPGTEALGMSTLFRELWGIDSASIIIEDKAQTTHDHAPLVKKILDERKLPLNIIVVTSAMHMYRSVLLLRKAGYTVYPAPTDFWVETRFPLNFFSFLPSAGALNMSTVALHEYYGILAYKIKGWI